MSEPRKASDAATRAARKLMERGFLASKMGVIPETARVIDEETAAPDLLAACDSAVQIIEQLIPEPSARGVADVVLFILRAAILKATGGAQ